MSAKSLDRSRIGLDYRHLGAISDRVVLSKLYNGKIPTESWLPPQYDGETKRHRDMGSMGTPSKNVAFVGTKARIKYNKRRIQPNNKATRKTLTLTIYMKKRPDWNKLESSCGCFSQFLRRSNRRFRSTQAWITRNKRSLIGGLVQVRLCERRIHAETECNLGTS